MVFKLWNLIIKILFVFFILYNKWILMFVECDYDMYFIKLFNRMKLISKIKIK